MLDAVTTVTTQASALRVASQPAASVVSAASSKSSSEGFVSSTIRVDNLQNVAILEYRSQEGEVVQQYPTQSQIDAFKSAERLLNKSPERAEPQEAPSSEGQHASPKAETHQAAAPAPHQAAPAEQHDGGGARLGGALHSVLA